MGRATGQTSEAGGWVAGTRGVSAVTLILCVLGFARAWAGENSAGAPAPSPAPASAQTQPASASSSATAVMPVAGATAAKPAAAATPPTAAAPPNSFLGSIDW